MDFGRYVQKKTSSAGKRHYIGPIEDPDAWADVVELFGTGSPKEIAQIVIGLARDVKAGKAEIVFRE